MGWLLHRCPRIALILIPLNNILYTIPSIALMIFLIPFFGLNARSVMAALIIYSQIILLRNIVSGFNNLDPAILEAARGMGMNPLQIAARIQIPIALPVILAGVRLACVISVAIATIGAKFGAGGLGVLLFEGIAQAGRMDKIWVGAIFVGLLAFFFNRGILWIEKTISGHWMQARQP
ncbi:MAG: ABC transporter permease [Bellilinea sp.]|nr:ABC transporter permease [Bellilinea sp.]